MERVLHLLLAPPEVTPAWFLGAARPGAGLEAAAVVCAGVLRGGGGRHQAAIVGGGSSAAWAEALGLSGVDRLPARLGSAALSGRAIAARARNRAGAVVCWAAPLARAARRWLPRGTEVFGVDLAAGLVHRVGPGWAANGGVRLDASPPRDSASGAGAAVDRARARAAIGIPPEQPAVGLVCDGPGATILLVRALAILSAAGLEATAVVPVGTDGWRRADRLSREARTVPVRRVRGPFSAVYPALDAAMLPSAGEGAADAGSLCLAEECLRAGTPVIGVGTTALTGGVLGVGAAKSAELADLAQAARRLLQAPGLRGELSRAASVRRVLATPLDAQVMAALTSLGVPG